MLTSRPVPAFWYDGHSARQHNVLLYYRAHGNELRICEPSQLNDVSPLAAWKTDAVRILSGKLSKSDIPLHLHILPDSGQRLVLQEPGSIEAVSEWLREPLREHKKKLVRRWFGGILAVWALCAAFYFSTPMIFSFLARVIPVSWEEKIGRSSRDSIIQVLLWLPAAKARGICEAGAQDEDLSRLFERLTESEPVRDYSFDLTVLDADFVNAFALPGGYMLVTTGLIKDCESPDELAGVLAHEMAHVTQRHGTGRMLREYAWASLLMMMGVGDSTSGSLARLVVTSSFDRDDEREADMLGAKRLQAARINPMAMADFFGRLEKSESSGSGILSYISSHPELGERRENIRRAAETGGQGADYSPAMEAAAWQRIRKLCADPGEMKKDGPRQQEPGREKTPERDENLPPVPQTGWETTASYGIL